MTALVTGSTDGVGRVVAKRLAAAGARVLVHGRDPRRGEDTVSAIAAAGGAAVFLRADLSGLAEVRALAQRVQDSTQRLHILINNAGLGMGDTRQLSPDGQELTFAVNYLSGFLLTRLLLPLIKGSAPATIINVSSLGQEPLDFKDLTLAHGYSGRRAYCQSKLAQIMFTLDLADELTGSGVTANCLHPATYMDTTMVRQAGIEPLSTVDEGADAILHLVQPGKTAGPSGRFFDGLRESRANRQAYDRAARDRLRELSIGLTGLASASPATDTDRSRSA